MLGVKAKPREMFKRFQLHILQPNTAQAQRLTIIRGPLYAQQLQLQQLTHQLSTAQAPKAIIIR